MARIRRPWCRTESPAQIPGAAALVVERLLVHVALQVLSASPSLPPGGGCDRCGCCMAIRPCASRVDRRPASRPLVAPRRGLLGRARPRARSSGRASTRSDELPREDGRGFSMAGGLAAFCAWRSRSDSSARSGGFGAGVSMRGCTKTNRGSSFFSADSSLTMSSWRRGDRLGQELGREQEQRHDRRVDGNRHTDTVAQVDGAPDGLDVRVTIVEVEVHQ